MESLATATQENMPAVLGLHVVAQTGPLEERLPALLADDSGTCTALRTLFVNAKLKFREERHATLGTKKSFVLLASKMDTDGVLGLEVLLASVTEKVPGLVLALKMQANDFDGVNAVVLTLF